METNPTTQVFLYNDSPVSFQMGNGDLMINTTQMAKSFGPEKRPQFWLNNQYSKDYLAELCKARNLALTDLVVVTKGGTSAGTWMHEDAAVEFARWLSPTFSIWCNDRIKELFHFGITATEEMLIKATSDPEFVMMMINQLKEKRNENNFLSDRNRVLEAQIAKNASKVKFFDNVKQLNESDQKRKTFTISKIASTMKISASALNRILIQRGVVTKTNGHMYINDKYKDCGYAFERITQSSRFDEETERFDMKDVTYLVWSLEGRDFIIDFLSELKKTRKSKCVKEIKYLNSTDV